METELVRVLVIEDDVVDQKAFRRAMADYGDKYALTFAQSYAEGRDALASGAFSLVLVDIELGDGSGVELLSRAAAKNVPSIVVTGRGSEALASKAFRNGAYDYVVKDSYNAYLQLLPDIMHNVLLRKQAEEERDRLLVELREALQTIQTLQGLVPICSNCKKVRDDEGYWKLVEQYVAERSPVEFSHGLCPDCYETKLADAEVKPRSS